MLSMNDADVNSVSDSVHALLTVYGLRISALVDVATYVSTLPGAPCSIETRPCDCVNVIIQVVTFHDQLIIQ